MKKPRDNKNPYGKAPYDKGAARLTVPCTTILSRRQGSARTGDDPEPVWVSQGQ